MCVGLIMFHPSFFRCTDLLILQFCVVLSNNDMQFCVVLPIRLLVARLQRCACPA